MRIYAIADIHGKQTHIKSIYSVIKAFDPDLVVAAGNLTHFLNFRTCLAQLDSLPVKVLAVRGNTDLKRINSHIDRASNMTTLTHIPLKIKDFSFVGAGGTWVLPFTSRICLRERQKLAAFASPMTLETIMVVHPPPKGICDRVGKRFSAGSKNIKNFIQKACPGLVICGHIHEDPGWARLGKTIVVNCSMGKTCAGAIIDLEQGIEPKVTLVHPDRI
ncbi:MAG: metallophosphoesterase family protein [Desulfobacter sp.]|nr:metallophosphoesterase family protein [Desulfobacter sp.]